MYWRFDMTVFTYSKARQNFSFLLNAASSEGEVLIKRRDGSVFTVRPVAMKDSPLDVSSIKTKVTTAQIVEAVRDSREVRLARRIPLKVVVSALREDRNRK
jgi:hypothetical protein